MRLEIHSIPLLLLYLPFTHSSPRFLGDSKNFFRLRIPCFGGGDLLTARGGSNQYDNSQGPDGSDSISHVYDVGLNSPISMLGGTKSRHCSDLVLDLRRRSTRDGDEDESLDLRRLITTRSLEYLHDLRDASHGNLEEPNHANKLPHPKKLLHFLAPKVPAIKHSPDVNLRIHSARSDMDSGVAACIISTIAHVCEVYAKQRVYQTQTEKSHKPSSATLEITTDRRFEQLIECVLSGVNVKKRRLEALRRRMDIDGESAENIEELLDEEDLEESDGLSTKDACRAAWGIAMLGTHHLENLGGEKVLDLLQALSLRTRELLLARLKLLRQDDLLSEPTLAHLTIEERMHELAEELAEDAASAMWTFACVKACTGLRSVPLFETCCSILCQDPVDLRRRAQEIDEKYGAKSLGNNDVIDRLARVNPGCDDEKEEESPRNTTTTSELLFLGKDALLDWLSKSQLNDVMWALAIHGRENTTTSVDDIMLSDTASVLGEIAFDRLIEALEQDLLVAQGQNETASESNTSKEVVEVKVDETMTVEVVDAATLLASETQASNILGTEFANKLPIESLTLRGSSVSEGPVQQVQVVDAAALLAASGDETSISFEREIPLSSSPPVAMKECNRDVQASTRLPFSSESTETRFGTDKQRIFSPHDLASIAWSVTELHDPLRKQVVPIVIKLVAMLGQSGIQFLSGADLANLAWAVSKFEAEASLNKAHRPNSLSISLISWISLTALGRVNNKDLLGESHSNVLDQFQPPELGRLLWAVACVMSTYAGIPGQVVKDANIFELGKLALVTASKNLSLFGTEDLLRICWSFLEICGNDDSFFDPTTSFALGRILSTVEQSLHRWERGDCASAVNGDVHSSTLVHEGSLFASFFGRSRLNQPLLEQEQSFGDHEEEDDIEFVPFSRRTRRPLLRDLSVDPSTLCKAACAFQRLLLKHPDIKGGWKLTNVAIRLLTSKNSRLMKECSVHDIIRLCEAAVRSEPESHGRELITGLFAHKVVQVLNDVLQESADSKHSTCINIEAASPAEVSTLIWALGNLGAKHSLPDEHRESAYKRLRLVTETSLLTIDQVKQLDLASAMKLLRGMVLMKYSHSDPKFLFHVLEEVSGKVGQLGTIDELCSLAETLALLKETLKTVEAPSQRISSRKLEVINDDKESTVNLCVDSDDVPLMSESTATRAENELATACDEVLTIISQKSRGFAKRLTTSELRRILTVYSLLPFQADDLINEIELEVTARLPSAEDQSLIMLEKTLQEAKERSETLQKTLFHETGWYGLTALKNGLISFFRSSDGNESEETKLSEDLVEMIQASINSTVEAATLLQEMKDSLRISIDSIGQSNREKTYFELGRCQELIANYRRIEFSTGSRRSRYDKERRRDISRLVLSRLLP